MQHILRAKTQQVQRTIAGNVPNDALVDIRAAAAVKGWSAATITERGRGAAGPGCQRV